MITSTIPNLKKKTILKRVSIHFLISALNNILLTYYNLGLIILILIIWELPDFIYRLLWNNWFAKANYNNCLYKSNLSQIKSQKPSMSNP